MCGRYVSPDESAIERAWHVGRAESNPFAARFARRYNVAPQQGNPLYFIPVVRQGAGAEPELVAMQWWLLPHWAKEARIRHSTFNARVESVATAPSFRIPFRRRRCLIPAAGWYEWQELPGGNRPWFIRPSDDDVVGIAGIWDVWRGGGITIESCAMVIGPANGAIGRFHDRMPFLITRERQAEWLDPSLTDADAVVKLLAAAPDDAVVCCRVGNRVNSARNDGPELIEPLPEAA
jgi:putative SOS response-associated peptidase YedK